MVVMPWPGFEPGLSRPQREVLTTIRSRPVRPYIINVKQDRYCKGETEKRIQLSFQIQVAHVVSGVMRTVPSNDFLQIALLAPGAVAQMVERSLSMWEVRGSIPRSSKIFRRSFVLNSVPFQYVNSRYPVMSRLFCTSFYSPLNKVTTRM